MFKTSMRVNINEQAILRRLNELYDVAEEDISEIALKDSEKYIPVESGNLLHSGRVTKEGIVWDTPYARKQYYEFPNKISVGNPRGSWKWFELAKRRHLTRWFRELVKNGITIKRR